MGAMTGSKPDIKKHKCSCGKPGKQRIIGGVEAIPNEFPWTVRIFGGCVCGGNALCQGKMYLTYWKH